MFRAIHVTCWTWLLALCFVLAWLPPLGAQQIGNDVAVVVNSGVPVDDLTISELRRVVLGDREFWPGGVRIRLIMRAPVAHERDVVLSLCRMTEAQIRQHWIAKVFRADTPLTPIVVSSNEAAVDLVNRFPGAIVFIDASLAGKGGLKVVKIEGHVPGEKGYVLR
jgi:hypothetical protein